MTEYNGDFSQGSVKSNIMKLAGPMIMAQLVGVLYNVVDRVFIGHIAQNGSLALTGLGVVFPLISLFNAFANWAGQGGAIIFAIQRGKGNKQQSKLALGNSASLLLILSTLLIIFVLSFENSLLKAFGGSEQTIPYARAYMRIYLLGTPFQLLSLGLNPFISAQGFPTIAMFSVLIGAVVNIVLDPLLIYVLGMGVQGAAIATIIAQFCSALWIVLFLIGKKANVKLSLEYLKLRASMVIEILKLGFANFCFQLTNTFTQAICNSVLLSYGGNMQVAVMTIVTSVRQIYYMPMDGLTAAVKPVLGYNYGAGHKDRVVQSIRIMLVSFLIFTSITTLIIMLIPAQIISLFTSDAKLIQLAVPSLKLFFIAFVFMSFQTAGQATFTALGMAKHATFFSIFRKLILIVPFTLLLPMIPALNVQGVYLAETLSQIIGGTACFTTMVAVVRKSFKHSK